MIIALLKDSSSGSFVKEQVEGRNTKSSLDELWHRWNIVMFWFKIRAMESVGKEWIQELEELECTD